MKLATKLLLLSTLISNLNASIDSDIAQILLFGFNGQTPSQQIKKDIKNGLGSVILFNKTMDKKVKNISSKEQLKKLTSTLQSIKKEKLFICVDQEGGKVRRLKKELGFYDLKSARFIGDEDNISLTKQSYKALANDLESVNINCVFAPVVDMAIEPKNPIIYKLDRSYSDKSEIIYKHASIFVNQMRKKHIVSVIKHFPGHGSSLSDSHKGFVDVSKTWDKKELEPFKLMIDNKKADMIMSAHIFNSNIDSTYPATMSYKTNTKLLRGKLNYKGLMISDDLQMRAISANFKLKDAVEKTLNSGVDILLFGNQLGNNTLDEISKIIKELIKSGKITKESISLKASRVREFKRKL